MLPSNLKYHSKIESAAARSYKSNIQPQNGTGPYKLNDTIIINIPTMANLCLSAAESYLKFRVTLTNPTAGASVYQRWDTCGAHGVIQRLRLFSGSNLLEDIDNYGLLVKNLMDLQVCDGVMKNKYSVISGTRNDLILHSGLDVSGNFITTQSVMNIKNGRRINTNNGGVSGIATTASSIPETYCINLVSLVGTLTDKYVPLFAMTSAPLRLELQLVSNTNACLCSDVALTMAIDNVEYIAQMVELSDQSMGIINQSLNGNPLQFVFTDFKNYQNTFNVSAGSSSVSIPIPAKYSSLKALIVNQRDSTQIGTPTIFPFSSNVFNLANYTFRIGPNVLPAKAPETTAEFFTEAIKSMGAMSNLYHQPSIDIDSYTQNVPVANNDTAEVNGNVSSGSFVIGLDLENYPNTNKTELFAGINSNTSDIYFNGNYVGLTNATTVRYDAYANFDSVLICENNTAYIKF